MVPTTRDRFMRSFGHLNYVFTVGGFDIVVLDTVSLSADHDKDIQQESADFLKGLSSVRLKRPRILFTHVPLYRDDQAGCERKSHRTSSSLHQARGYQYQNLVTEEWSRRILETVKPVIVFSGDDHDQCLYYHSTKNRRIPEVRSYGLISS